MRQRVVALALAAGLAALSVRADEYSIAPAFTGETGLFTLSTGDTIEQGGWTFSIWLANLDRVLDLPVDDELRGFDRTTARVNIGYGVTDRFELFAGLPYEDLNFDSRIAEDETGIGNPRLGAKFRLSGERGSDRTLALTVFGEPATGDEAVSSEDAGFGAYLGWRLNKWVINLGFYEPGEREARFNAGVGYVTAVSENLDWITELSASIYDDTLEDAYDLTTGGRVWLGAERNVAFSFALRTDLAQADAFDEHCPIGGLIGLAFVPGARRAAPVEPEPAPAPPPAPPPPPPTPAPPPPAPAPPPPAPAPPPEVRETIHFTAGSARLSNIAKAKLDEVALKMKQDPSLTAQIIGHSDAGGSASANDRMSQQRAEAAKAYLISRHGIDAARITSEGRGSAEATGNAAEDRKAVIILRVQ